MYNYDTVTYEAHILSILSYCYLLIFSLVVAFTFWRFLFLFLVVLPVMVNKGEYILDFLTTRLMV